MDPDIHLSDDVKVLDSWLEYRSDGKKGLGSRYLG